MRLAMQKHSESAIGIAALSASGHSGLYRVALVVRLRQPALAHQVEIDGPLKLALIGRFGAATARPGWRFVSENRRKTGAERPNFLQMHRKPAGPAVFAICDSFVTVAKTTCVGAGMGLDTIRLRTSHKPHDARDARESAECRDEFQQQSAQDVHASGAPGPFRP